jgi:hypothetical protein
MIYFVVFILLLLSALNGKKNSVEDKLNYNLLLVFLILLSGLRFRVGGDSLGYMDDFNGLPTLSQLGTFDFKSAYYDPLWYIFNALIKSIFDDFTFFQLVQSIIVNTTIFWVIKKYSRYKYWSVLFYYVLYYLYFNTEILRESLAVCVFLCSIPFLLKRKWLAYYLFAFIGFNFHSSALVLFFIPFLFRRLKISYYVIVVSLLILFTFFITPFQFFSPFYFNERIYEKAFTYTNIDFNIYGVFMQFISVLPVIGFQRIRKINKLETHKFEYLMTAYIVIGLLSLVITGFYRFLNFLSIFSVIYIVDTSIFIFRHRKYQIKKLVLVNFFLTILFCYQAYIMFRDTSQYQPYTKFYNRYIPYYSVFNRTVDKPRENLYFKSMGLWQ